MTSPTVRQGAVGLALLLVEVKANRMRLAFFVAATLS
jgi:hypothetical protein